MTRRRRVGACLGRSWLTSLAMVLALPAFAGLVEGARAMPPLKAGAPERTDVLFSVRFPRAAAIDVARAYGTTRVVWHYARDPAFVKQLQAVTPHIGLTMNANGPLADPAGRVLNFDGEALGAPWMKTWGVYWVASTHPASREAATAEIHRLIGLGAESIQFDDPTLQLFAGLHQAGDFNPATQRGFRPWLDQNVPEQELRSLGLDKLGDDYRGWLQARHGVRDARDYQRRMGSFPSTVYWLRYLRATVVEHFVWLKKEASAVAGQPVPLSMNLSVLFEPTDVNPQFFLAFEADFAMSEAQIIDPARMTSQWAVARAAGLGSAPSILPRSRAENRIALAHLYALGSTPLAPWDVYIGNDDRGRPQRFFGAPEDYADIFRFVRNFPEFHEGLEVAPLVGVIVPVRSVQSERVREFVRRLYERQIPFRFVFAGGKEFASGSQEDLRYLDRLWLVGEPAQLTSEDRALLEQVQKRPLRTDAQLTDEELDGIRPLLLAPEQSGLRWVPRVDPAGADRLVLHLIDEARGEVRDIDMNCRRRIGIDESWLDGRHIVGARSVSLNQDTASILRVERERRGVFLTVSGCSLWTVFELSLQ